MLTASFLAFDPKRKSRMLASCRHLCRKNIQCRKTYIALNPAAVGKPRTGKWHGEVDQEQLIAITSSGMAVNNTEAIVTTTNNVLKFIRCADIAWN